MKIELYDSQDNLITIMDVPLYIKIKKDNEYVHCFGYKDMNFDIQLNEKSLKGSKMLVDGKKFIEKDGRFMEYKEEKGLIKKIGNDDETPGRWLKIDDFFKENE